MTKDSKTVGTHEYFLNLADEAANYPPVLRGDLIEGQDDSHLEIQNVICSNLDVIAPCEVKLFMRQSGRFVFHITPCVPDHLALVHAAIVADRYFLNILDIDREDVGLADDHIRISVPT